MITTLFLIFYIFICIPDYTYIFFSIIFQFYLLVTTAKYFPTLLLFYAYLRLCFKEYIKYNDVGLLAILIF